MYALKYVRIQTMCAFKLCVHSNMYVLEKCMHTNMRARKMCVHLNKAYTQIYVLRMTVAVTTTTTVKKGESDRLLLQLGCITVWRNSEIFTTK